jgi:membrane-bound ClpP family serine protease
MTIALIIVMIVIGMALIVVEALVLPGVTVAGIGGLLLIAGSVFLTFRWFGNTAGACSLAGSSLLFIIFLIYALRAKTWDRLSLHAEIGGRVNEANTGDIKVGDSGMTVSRLAPIGKILVGGKIMEGKSEFGLIDENSEIEVVQISGPTVTVRKSKLT